MDRFVIRNVRKYVYNQLGWIIDDLGYVYAIYDNEWKRNYEVALKKFRDAVGNLPFGHSSTEYEYVVNYTRSKEVAQHWADWLNANYSEKFDGHQIIIPMAIANK